MAVYTILLLGEIELQLVNAPLAVAIKLSLLINSLSNNIMILVIDVQMHHRLRSNHPRTKSFFCIPVTGKRVRTNKKVNEAGHVDFLVAPASICPRPECAKSFSCGNACYTGYCIPMLSLNSILLDFSIYDL